VLPGADWQGTGVTHWEAVCSQEVKGSRLLVEEYPVEAGRRSGSLNLTV
jgi:hypothetical protein